MSLKMGAAVLVCLAGLAAEVGGQAKDSASDRRHVRGKDARRAYPPRVCPT